MRIPVREATRQLEKRGLLKRERHDHADRIVEHVRSLLGRELPTDLIDFYRERIASVGEFPSTMPHWNERVGCRQAAFNRIVRTPTQFRSSTTGVATSTAWI